MAKLLFEWKLLIIFFHICIFSKLNIDRLFFKDMYNEMNLIKLHTCIVFNKLFFNLLYNYCIFAIDNDFCG